MPTSLLSSGPVGADYQAALLELAAALIRAREPDALLPGLPAQLARALPATWQIRLADGGTLVQAYPPAAQPLGLMDEDLQRLRVGEAVLREGGRLLAVPLSRAGLLGCLAARRATPFSEPELQFARAAGLLVGSALEAARVLSAAERRGRDAEAVEAIAQDLGGSLELGEVVERIGVRAHELVRRPVVVWLLEEDRVRAVARAGGALVLLGEERTLSAAALAELRARATAAGAVEDRQRQRRRLADLGSLILRGDDAQPADARRVLVPLVLGDRLIGFLAVGPWGGDALADEQLALLHRMAPHAASAIENARLHAQVRRLSLTDPLVQLPNRRQLDLFLEREFAAAERGRPLCFVLFDLDHFKAYNDTHGHRAGDIALIRFADVLRQETRSMNLAARYGGEEFAAVLSSTSLAGGLAYGERVRRRVQEVFAGDLTVSGGVATYRQPMKTSIDLVVAADRALYRAKTDGRNRVHAAEE